MWLLSQIKVLICVGKFIRNILIYNMPGFFRVMTELQELENLDNSDFTCPLHVVRETFGISGFSVKLVNIDLFTALTVYKYIALLHYLYIFQKTCLITKKNIFIHEICWYLGMLCIEPILRDHITWFISIR